MSNIETNLAVLDNPQEETPPSSDQTLGTAGVLLADTASESTDTTEQHAPTKPMDIGKTALHGTEVLSDRSGEVFRIKRKIDPKTGQEDTNTCEVTIESDITLEDYENIVHPVDMISLLEWAKPLQGKKIIFVNPTMEGGGVAMMRPPVIHLMRLLGIDAQWHVMRPIIDEESSGNPYLFTKLMHNMSQNKKVKDGNGNLVDGVLTQEGKDLHKQWADTENGPILEQAILDADHIIIDDPQPAPLIPRFLKAMKASAKIYWRNHIHTDATKMKDPDSPEGQVAHYLLDDCQMKEVDAIFMHPVLEFLHPGMEDKTYFSPATLETMDNLNKELSEQEIIEGIQFINSEIEIKNEELQKSDHPEDVMQQLDLNPAKKRISLIARFDPSKGMDHAMKMGVMTREKMRAEGVAEEDLPETVIVGNGSVDDPDGVGMYKEMLKERRKYPTEMNGIILMRLRHNYDAMNALMRRSTMLMQTSTKEGCETRISDGIMHDTAVVVANNGGMPGQVIDGESGLIIDGAMKDEALNEGAEFMCQHLTDDVAMAKLTASTIKAGEEHNKRNYLTIANVVRFCRAFTRTEVGLPADKTYLMQDIATELEQLN